LNARGALGGPTYLSRQDFYFGINDVIAGDYRTGAPFDNVVFRLYDAWMSVLPENPAAGVRHDVVQARQAVARGQALFNSKPIQIVAVKGLNDDLGVAIFSGTCTTCHDTPQAGNHSVPALFDTGLTDAARRTPDLPLYTLRNKQTSQLVETTDPGRALITGKCADAGAILPQQFRGLAARAPYFSNGSAATLGELVDFYDQRFSIGLSAQEKSDLANLLSIF